MASSTVKTQLKQLYKIDEHLWLENTIELLKDNRLEDLDLENLIEELESLGKRDKNRFGEAILPTIFEAG